MDLNQEAAELTKLLASKTVLQVRRHRQNEVVIEFSDGTRFFADTLTEQIRFSVTG